MTYPVSLEDTSTSPIPIAQAYADGQNKFVANQASPYTHVDGNSNESGGVVVLPAPSTNGLPVTLPSITQKANAVTGSGAKTLAIAFANNNTAGNSIIVALGMGEVEASGITLAVTDSLGNTYTEAVKGSNSTTQEAAIFYATNILPGANTVTVTIAGASSSNTAIAAEIYEVQGLITVASLVVDQTANNSNAGSTAVSTANITPNYSNEIAFMAIAAAGGTITAGSGWTPDTGSALSPTGGNLVSFAAQSRVQMTQGPLVPAATLGTSNAWAACTAVFRSMHTPIEGTHIVQGGFAEVFGSAGSANADIINMDVRGYQSLSLQLNSNAFSGTLTFQGSGDGVTWQSIPMYNSQGNNFTTMNFGSAGYFYTVPISFRYFRARMTSYTSGAAQGTIQLSTLPTAMQYVSVLNTATISGSGLTVYGYSFGNFTAIAFSSYTTTQTQNDQTNYSARGVRVVLNVNNAGTGSITLEIDAKDSVSGVYIALLTGVAVTANGTYVYEIYPGLTPVANQVVSDVLSSTWRVKVTANNANAMTYSVGGHYLP
jgi:hypothetical protein